MKERGNVSKSFLGIFLLGVLLISFVIAGIGMVGADDVTINYFLFGDEQSSNAFFSTPFYNNFIKPYFIPEGMGDNFGALIIGIITLAILLSIMVDILLLVSPFSNVTNWIIGVGIGLLMILSGANVTVGAWVFLVGSAIFGFAGIAAGLLTIVMSILALVFIFFGGQWIRKWIITTRARRRELDLTKKALNSAAEIKSFRKLAEESMK